MVFEQTHSLCGLRASAQQEQSGYKLGAKGPLNTHTCLREESSVVFLLVATGQWVRPQPGCFSCATA